jgi:hypothetical protein
MPYNQARLPAIVDYDEWLRGTSSLLQPRSAALKALDQQILTYHRYRST